ncbi:MAG: hypothetical protein KatS3mg055_2300 [Chloroflexus sp.]|nr:hypothetical protein [Chloroflexus sp.]GIV89782.1 MAG: hypothetical protein KatS3mg055_2300 [Chloroflexus sp.]
MTTSVTQPDDGIIWQSASALARCIRAGELTARAVVDAHIPAH